MNKGALSGVVRAPAVGTAKSIMRVRTGTLTTTSTSKTPIDATNLAYLTFNLVAGDTVELDLNCTAVNSTVAWLVGFDFEVDLPVSANIYVAGDFGCAVMQGNVRMPISAHAIFTCTEAGLHGFRPVWLVEGNTGTIFNAASSTGDVAICFSARFLGPAAA